MDTAQVQPRAASKPPERMAMYAALIKLLAQPSLMPLPGGKHTRSGFTKNKFQGESKTRRRMAKASRARNRGR